MCVIYAHPVTESVTSLTSSLIGAPATLPMSKPLHSTKGTVFRRVELSTIIYGTLAYFQTLVCICYMPNLDLVLFSAWCKQPHTFTAGYYQNSYGTITSSYYKYVYIFEHRIAYTIHIVSMFAFLCANIWLVV